MQYKKMIYSFGFGNGETEEEKKKREEEEAKNRAKTYTQEEFDKHAAAQRRKYEEETKKTVQELNNLKKNQQLSDEEKAKLSSQISALEQTYLTDKELKERQIALLEQQKKEETERLKQRADQLERQLTEMQVDHELTKETAAVDEYIPGQLSRFLRPDTQTVDEIGEDGKPTGKKAVKIKFKDVDPKTGKPTELLLSVGETLKKMKENPKQYGNFFKSTLKGGIGGTNQVGAGGGAMPKDTESYIAQRNSGK